MTSVVLLNASTTEILERAPRALLQQRTYPWESPSSLATELYQARILLALLLAEKMSPMYFSWSPSKSRILLTILLAVATLLFATITHVFESNHKRTYDTLPLAVRKSNSIGSSKRGRMIISDAIQPRIVNGTPTNLNQYPFMAALFADTAYRCGGSLIAPDIVLTAAHCADFVNVVKIGRRYLEGSSSIGGDAEISMYEEFQIIETAEQPNYRPRTYNKDVALLKLSKASIHRPIKMNNDPNVPSDGQELVVMGYGETYYGSPVSNTLLQTQVYYMTNEQCRATAYDDKEITDSMLCAAAPGADACTGDSGGPLIIAGGSDGDLLVGVISFGRGCADPDYPGVYSRVSFNYDWIVSTVCTLSVESCAYLTNCKDASSFVSDGGEEKNCEWVGRRSSIRCPRYGMQYCKVTCYLCGS